MSKEIEQLIEALRKDMEKNKKVQADINDGLVKSCQEMAKHIDEQQKTINELNEKIQTVHKIGFLQ